MFTGFTPETMDFLWGIRMNNNRDWFTQHKGDYVRTLYEPMKELGQAVFQPFLERPGNLLKVSRIYRDARMHPPTPYKESLWLCIRRRAATASTTTLWSITASAFWDCEAAAGITPVPISTPSGKCTAGFRSSPGS